MKISPLQKARYEYSPKLPGMLRNGISDICVKEGEPTQSVADQDKIKALFPNTYGKKEITFQKGTNTSVAKKQVVGVILSGGQAPGGHNVVSGLYDALKAADRNNVLLGFRNGPSGLVEDDFVEFNDEFINEYRNTGGFDIIGSGRTKLETEDQFQESYKQSFFTNDDIINAHYKENSFDIAYCKNTLHHLNSDENIIKFLNNLFKISNKIILVEIENPDIHGGLPKFWHKYLFRGFLKDAGHHFLDTSNFTNIINNTFGNNCNIEYFTFKNILGTYMISVIEKR